MKKSLMIIPLVILLCFAFGCQQGEEVAEETAVDVEADITALKKIEEEWAAANTSGDIDKLVSFFTDNAVNIPPNEPALIGKEAIRDWFQQYFDQFTMEEDGTVVDVQVSGDLAFTRGTFTSIQTPKTVGESLKSNGSWVTIYRKQSDGTWRCICNIWSDESLVSPTQSEE
jgi:uncharacterized protein (TIGR02246 family)